MISVVVPTYNEAENLPELLERLGLGGEELRGGCG
jgi:GT2 family glycosyltransferase